LSDKFSLRALETRAKVLGAEGFGTARPQIRLLSLLEALIEGFSRSDIDDAKNYRVQRLLESRTACGESF
jgi:hypothetical protein